MSRFEGGRRRVPEPVSLCPVLPFPTRVAVLSRRSPPPYLGSFHAEFRSRSRTELIRLGGLQCAARARLCGRQLTWRENLHHQLIDERPENMFSLRTLQVPHMFLSANRRSVQRQSGEHHTHMISSASMAVERRAQRAKTVGKYELSGECSETGHHLYTRTKRVAAGRVEQDKGPQRQRLRMNCTCGIARGGIVCATSLREGPLGRPLCLSRVFRLAKALGKEILSQSPRKQGSTGKHIVRGLGDDIFVHFVVARTRWLHTKSRSGI